MKIQAGSNADRIRPHAGLKILLAILLVALAALYVLHASRPGSRVEGCPGGCATSLTRTEGGLRVVSLNMLHGFPLFSNLQLRVDLISDEVRKLDADVLLLQEVPWTLRTGNVAELLANRLGYNYLYYRANGNKNLIFFEQGEAILSRFELSDAMYTELKPRASFFDSRVALGATVITPWGDLDVYVTHLTNEKLQVASMQAEALHQFVATHTTGSAVIGGDFNSPENSPQIVELSQAWTDTYRVAHPVEAGYTCCVDNLQAEGAIPMDERIDYIFLAPKIGGSWKLVSAWKVFDQPFKVNDGWQWASDHVGLMAEIQP